MARSLYVYTPLDLRLLEEVVDAHVQSFGEELKDIFSDDELESFHRELEEMAPFSVCSRPHDLRFEDFDTDPNAEDKKLLFTRSKTSIVIENLPFLETNPFQVSSLRSLLGRLPEVLVDDEGLGELFTKEEYLQKLSPLKGIETYPQETATVIVAEKRKLFVPVDPIDFLIRDVYQEMERILRDGLLEKTLLHLQDEKEFMKDLFFIIRENRPSPEELFKRSGLIAKDFDDSLEKLKFFLRKSL